MINEDQAETVRIIFNMYLQQNGQIKIAKELCRLGRKDGHGQVSWEASKVSRILRNATYKGYKCYLKSYSNNYLEQKRINNLDEETYLYIKGDFEPIVSEEVWDKCSEIRKSRTVKMIVNKGERTYGRKESQDVWLRKLRCKCGSNFRKNKWRTNKQGDVVFGYQCYNQVNNGSKGFREKNGLSIEGYCDIRMVGDWKLELMAKKIFEGIWTERKEAVLEVYRMLKAHYQTDDRSSKATISAIEGKVERLKSKIDNLISMRADGEITKEELISLRGTTEAELKNLIEERGRIQEPPEDMVKLDMKEIKLALDKLIDFSKTKIDESIIDKFVTRVVPLNNGQYRWDMNFSSSEMQAVVCSIEGRKNKADATIEDESEGSPHTYIVNSDYNNINNNDKKTYHGYVQHRQHWQVNSS